MITFFRKPLPDQEFRKSLVGMLRGSWELWKGFERSSLALGLSGGPLGASWGAFGSLLGPLGALLEASWGLLGASWTLLSRLGGDPKQDKNKEHF